MSTSGEEWKIVDEVPGSTQGEILKGLLNAQGIEVILSEEGAGRTMGFGVGPMGTVQILVPESSYTDAMAILEEYYQGDLIISDQDDGAADDGNP